MPLYFKESKYTSFTRRLNRWNFTIQTHGHKKASYFHPMFIRGDPVRCLDMKPASQSRKNSGSGSSSRGQGSSDPPTGDLPLTNSGKDDEGQQGTTELESDQKPKSGSSNTESAFQPPSNSLIANESLSASASSASQQWRNMDPIMQQMMSSNINPRYHAMLNQNRLNTSQEHPSHWQQGTIQNPSRFYPNLMHNSRNPLPFGAYSPQSHFPPMPPTQPFLSHSRALMQQQQNFPSTSFLDASRSAAGSAHLPPTYGMANFPTTGLNTSNLGFNPLMNQSYLPQQSMQDIPANLRMSQLSNMDLPARSVQGDTKHSDKTADDKDKGAKSGDDKFHPS